MYRNMFSNCVSVYSNISMQELFKITNRDIDIQRLEYKSYISYKRKINETLKKY